MKQKLISLSLLLLVLSICIVVVDFFLEIPKKPQEPSVASPFLRFTNHYTGFPSAYLVVGGDIMLSRNIGYYNKRDGYDRIFGSGTYNPVSAFTGCHVENCLLFFNLESLFHPKDNDIQMGGFTFRANSANIAVLKQLRQPAPHQVNGREWDFPLLVSLANNHMVNVGYEGMVETQEVLHFGGDIGHIGAGTTPEEARRIGQYLFNETCKNGICTGLLVCFQAYSYEGKENIRVWWGRISWNPLEKKLVLADLEEMKKLDCDVKVLSLHRGAEYRLHPNQRQKTLAHELIDAGADVILGGHSHVPGEIERYQGKYIFYSLGNFIFDQGRGKKATEAGFDYIYDYTLKRKTVPTYIATLAGLKIVHFPRGTRILFDTLTMSTTTDGVHQPLDAQTFSGVVSEILSL